MMWQFYNFVTTSFTEFMTPISNDVFCPVRLTFKTNFKIAHSMET